MGWFLGTQSGPLGWIVGAALVGVWCLVVVILGWSLAALAESAFGVLGYNFAIVAGRLYKTRSQRSGTRFAQGVKPAR